MDDFYKIWLLIMSLAGIFGGIHYIYTKRVNTYGGLLGTTPRKVFTGYTAQLWGCLSFISGFALLLKILDAELIPFLHIGHIGIFYFISFFICGLIIQLIENRLRKHI